MSGRRYQATDRLALLKLLESWSPAFDLRDGGEGRCCVS